MRPKRWLALTGVAGLALALWVITREGVRDILGVLDSAGWSLLWLIPLHIIPVTVDARGWQALLRPFDPQHHATLPFLSRIAAVREAVNRLLPVVSVGGDLIGIRLALVRPLSGTAVTASVLVEVLLTVVNLYLFTAIGLVLLVVLLHDTPTTHGIEIGLLATLPIPIVLYFLLRNGRAFERLKRVVSHLVGADNQVLARLSGPATELDHTLGILLRMPKPLVIALAWQLVGMALGGGETWFALWLLGHPVSPWEALVLESLVLAMRNVAFFVPAAIGVQEVSLVVFGNLIGVPADVCVALSLAKRMRDIGFGLPALLSWPWIAGRSPRTGVAPRVESSTGP